MADVLLIHGAGHGAWCWDGLCRELAALGHSARAIDLPARGADDRPAASVTLECFMEAILAAMPKGGIAVAHSMAGVPLTGAADRQPALFARLVYLCAYLPRDGDSIASLVRAQARQPLAAAIRRSPGGGAFGFDPALAPALFYGDCPEDETRRALARLVPEPSLPQATPLALTGAAARLPRSYILCRNDRAIPPEDQRRMAAGLADEDIHEADWSHSPFLSDPAGLAALLDRIAKD